MIMVRFFFSSRRRHTIWTGDWSSDVCSSDLTLDFVTGNLQCIILPRLQYAGGTYKGNILSDLPPEKGKARSEERRVGKECRSRRAPAHRSRTPSGPRSSR